MPAIVYDDCSVAGNLSAMTSPYAGSTVGGVNDYSFCTMGSAADQIFYYDLPVGSTLTIQQTSNGYDSRHSLRYSGACPGTIEIVCTDDPDTQVESWQNCTGSTQRVYWIQSGFSTGSGTYNLSWSVTAGTCPVPPANDDCGGAYAVTVNPDFSCTSTTAGTILNATASSQSAASCGGTEDDDVWFSFVATGTTHTIDLLNVSGSTTDLYHSVWSGTCPTLTLVAGTCSDPNSQTLTGLTPGTTYYIRVYSWTATGGQTTTFDVCIGTPPPPPANDDCGGAFPVTVNPDYSCTSTTSGTVASATASSQSAASCGGTEDDDVWFSFVATGTTHTIDILNITGSTTDMYHSVWSGTCPTLTLVAGTCSDPNNQTVTGLTPGTTYYIRVYTWTSTAGQTSSFDVCIGTPPPPPANDECSGAFPVTVNTGNCASTTAGSVGSATGSSQNTASCGGTEDDDVWFTFTAPATGAVQIDLLNITGSTTDLYHSVWSGTCPTLTVVAGSCSDPNTSNLTGLTPGATYYVRVYTWTGTAGQTSSFDICIQEAGPCGNASNNDWCSDPATLSPGAGSWNSTTSSTYTSDTPANLNSVFCGSIENNSWYSFTATSTTESFPFTNIINCNNGWGVQAEVYNVTTDANGCCTNFTSMSNCYNPATTAPGTVTATGLTVGNTYYLMVDGNAGDDCDFTVTGWTATGILPVTLTNFSGYPYQNYNKIVWTTESEINNDYFIIQKSTDAEGFTNIGTVKGNGNSTVLNEYSFVDETPEYRTFYRLKQIDFDGKYEYSNIIYVNRLDELGVFLYPNPSKGKLNIDITKNNIGSSKILITYSDILGKTVFETIVLNDGKNTYQSNEFTNLNNGIYFVQIRTENGELIKTDKIIKE